MVTVTSRRLTAEELRRGYEEVKACFPDATPDDGPFWVALADRGDGFGWRGYGNDSMAAEIDANMAVRDCEPVRLEEFEEYESSR